GAADAHDGRVHLPAAQHLHVILAPSRRVHRDVGVAPARAAKSASESDIEANRSWSTSRDASWFERAVSAPMGSAVQSDRTTQWKSRNIASRTVDSTHTLVVAPTKMIVSTSRVRIVAS